MRHTVKSRRRVRIPVARKSFFCCDEKMRRSFKSIMCLWMLCIMGSFSNVLALETEPLPAGFVKIMKKISKQVPWIGNNEMSCHIINSELFMEAYALWKNEKDPVRKRYAQYEIQGLLFAMMNDKFFKGQFDQKNPVGLDKAVIEILVGGDFDKSEITSRKWSNRIKLTTYRLDKTDRLKKNSELGSCYTELGSMVDTHPENTNLLSLQRDYILNPISKTAVQIMHNEDTYFINQKPFSFKEYLINGIDLESNASHLRDGSCISASYLSDGSLLCAFEKKNYENDETFIKLLFYDNKPQQIFSKTIKVATGGRQDALYVYPNPNNSEAWNLSVIDGGDRGWYSEGTQDWIVYKSGKIENVRRKRNIEHDSSEFSNKALVSLFKGLPFPSYRTHLSGFHLFRDFKNDDLGRCGMNRHYGGGMMLTINPSTEVSPRKSDDSIESSIGPSFDWSVGESAFSPITAHKNGFMDVPWDVNGSSVADRMSWPLSWPSSRNFAISSEVFSRPWNNYIGTGVNPKDKDPVDDATFFYSENGDFQRWIKGIVAGDAADGKSLVISQRTGQVLTLSPDYKVTQVREFIAPDKSVAKAVSILDSHKAGIFLVGDEVVLGVWK